MCEIPERHFMPCPFCGKYNLDYGIVDEYDGAYTEDFVIYCLDCGIHGPSAGNFSWGRDDFGRPHKSKNGLEKTREKFFDEAVRLWNHRLMAKEETINEHSLE